MVASDRYRDAGPSRPNSGILPILLLVLTLVFPPAAILVATAAARHAAHMPDRQLARLYAAIALTGGIGLGLWIAAALNDFGLVLLLSGWMIVMAIAVVTTLAWLMVRRA